MSTLTWQEFERGALRVVGAVIYSDAPINHPMLVRAQENDVSAKLLPPGFDCGVDGFDDTRLFQVKCMAAIGAAVVRDVVGMRRTLRKANLAFDDMYLVVPANANVSAYATLFADLNRLEIIRVSDEEIGRHAAAPRAHPALADLCDLQRRMVRDVMAKVAAGERRVSMQAPPGFGKTMVMRAIVRELNLGRAARVLELTYDAGAAAQHRDEVQAMRNADGRVCSFESRTHAWLDHAAEDGPYDVVFVDEGHHFDDVRNSRRGAVERLLAPQGVAFRQSALFALDPGDDLWGAKGLAADVTYDQAITAGRVVELHLGLVHATAADVGGEARRPVATKVVADFLAHSLLEPDGARFGHVGVGELSLVFFTSITDARQAYELFCEAGGARARSMARLVYGDCKEHPRVTPPNVAELNDPAGGVRVVFAVGMLNEGVSIHRTSDVWFADARLSVKNTWQVAGRAMRTFTGKHVARIWLPPVHDSIEGSACAGMLRRLMAHDDGLRLQLEARRAVHSGADVDATTALRARAVNVACGVAALEATGVVEVLSCTALDARMHNQDARIIEAVRALYEKPKRGSNQPLIDVDGTVLSHNAELVLCGWRQSMYRRKLTEMSTTARDQIEAPGAPIWLERLISQWKVARTDMLTRRIIAMRALPDMPRSGSVQPLIEIDGTVIARDAAALLRQWCKAYRRHTHSRQLSADARDHLEAGAPVWLEHLIGRWKVPSCDMVTRRIAAVRKLPDRPTLASKQPLIDVDGTVLANNAASVIMRWYVSSYSSSTTALRRINTALSIDERAQLEESTGAPRWVTDMINNWKTSSKRKRDM